MNYALKLYEEYKFKNGMRSRILAENNRLLSKKEFIDQEIELWCKLDHDPNHNIVKCFGRCRPNVCH